MLNLPADSLRSLAQAELRQLQEEGRRTDELEALYRQAAEGDETAAGRIIRQFWHMAGDARVRDDWQYDEPSAWDDLVAACPTLSTAESELPSRQTLADRLRGAWVGRCVGCMLGKPVEGRSRDEIARLLHSAGQYPLRDYFPVIEDSGGIAYPPADDETLGPNLRYSARDDDIDYTVLGLHLAKTYGLELTTADVGSEWLARLPYLKTYTAERAAYRNLVCEVAAERAAVVLNPYREWIGAQIRADAFGYVCPGWPAQAARLAWQDAALSHVKNGIYGEMFFAALLAECTVRDLGQTAVAIEAALGVVPPRGRFAEMVQRVTTWCRHDEMWEVTRDRIEEHYGHYHPVHSLNNAAVVLMSLLHSDGDFGRAICIAVMGGWDTDCNGATAGSVMGALLGGGGLPDRWVAPLNDTLHSAIDGYRRCAISGLADESLQVALRVRDEALRA